MGSEMFFGHPIDLLSIGGKGMVLLMAALFGGLIGLERQLHGNAAGLRTHIMVCVGSTVMTLTSVEIGLGVRGGMRGDPGHIAAQIVSGIGFLGAGAILREGLSVHGLTTAASIWATAGIGIALGASPRLGELAVLATVIVLGTLAVLVRFEEWCNLKQAIHTLQIEVQEAEGSAASMLDHLVAHNIIVYGIQSEAGFASLTKGSPGPTRQMRMRVRLPRDFKRNEFNAWIMEAKGVRAFHLE